MIYVWMNIKKHLAMEVHYIFNQLTPNQHAWFGSKSQLWLRAWIARQPPVFVRYSPVNQPKKVPSQSRWTRPLQDCTLRKSKCTVDLLKVMLATESHVSRCPHLVPPIFMLAREPRKVPSGPIMWKSTLTLLTSTKQSLVFYSYTPGVNKIVDVSWA